MKKPTKRESALLERGARIAAEFHRLGYRAQYETVPAPAGFIGPVLRVQFSGCSLLDATVALTRVDSIRDVELVRDDG